QIFRRAMRANNASQRIAIGDGQRRESLFGRTQRKFIRMRSSFEKRKIRFAMQLGIAGPKHSEMNRWSDARTLAGDLGIRHYRNFQPPIKPKDSMHRIKNSPFNPPTDRMTVT